MKKLLIYLLVFVMTVAGCFGMLLLATFAPQERVDYHIQQSVDKFVLESSDPVIWDRSASTILDSFTEALILMESKAMVSDSKSTVLTNPLYLYSGDPVADLQEYAHMTKPAPTGYYTRYWMGFRAVTRWLLTFLDYFQIRRYVGSTLFVLFFVLICSISRHLDNRQALTFALSIFLVHPQVIASCLQYSCCFLIAFFAMLLVPWIHKNPKFQALFFMELGMMTMYFDFYTTPLVTFGLPMIYLCLLQAKENPKICLRGGILKHAFIWLTAYVGMWLSKLVLTELLTDQPAVQDTWKSVVGRLGLSQQIRLENSEMYSPLNALESVWKTILPDSASVVVFIVLLSALAVLLVYKIKKKALNYDAARRSIGILIIAVFPIIWFCITPQPIVIHAFFQYRTIVLLYWAIGAYLCLITEKTNPSPILEKNWQENEK